MLGTVFDFKKQQLVNRKATTIDDPKAILMERLFVALYLI